MALLGYKCSGVVPDAALTGMDYAFAGGLTRAVNYAAVGLRELVESMVNAIQAGDHGARTMQAMQTAETRGATEPRMAPTSKLAHRGHGRKAGYPG